MFKTLQISFRLKNTYRVNSILYAIRQIPLLKRVLSDRLYQMRGPKIFAGILALIWEILSIFLGKFLYFLTLVVGLSALYDGQNSSAVFCHILLFLTILGGFANTHLFHATRDSYYALMLLRMDARQYMLVHYGYNLLKTLIGFMPFALVFGLQRGVHPGLCILIPFFVVGVKLTAAGITLRHCKKSGEYYDEDKPKRWYWPTAALLLALAHGLSALHITLPLGVSAAIMGLCVLTGLCSIPEILHFPNFRPLCQQLLSRLFTQMDQAKDATRTASRKAITADPAITSRRSGFAYLNELFVRRHRKILWRTATRIAAVEAIGAVGVFVALLLRPELEQGVLALLLNALPYFVFILYAINRGPSFTQALFVNCDCSLLTYSFYKQPQMILKLFLIRLREIVKVNLLPAAVLGFALAALLYFTGGRAYLLDCCVMVVSVLSLSIFFSVHYLTVYYLLQPYTVATQIKSGTYRLVMWVTYFICFLLMRLRMATLTFGLGCIAFCIVYWVGSAILVYRLAPRTFRLRTGS